MCGQGTIDKLKIADEFSRCVGISPPKTDLRLTEQTVVSLYSEAVTEWGSIMEKRPKGDKPISPEKVEDDLAAWLDDLDIKDEDSESNCARPDFSRNRMELYRCSWCSNPSAVLRKCAGCSKARYGPSSLCIY